MIPFLNTESRRRMAAIAGATFFFSGTEVALPLWTTQELGFSAAAMFLLGLLEHWIGMRAIFLYGGLLGALFALTFFRLPSPRKRSHAS
jgi:hypothetical protein